MVAAPVINSAGGLPVIVGRPQPDSFPPGTRRSQTSGTAPVPRSQRHRHRCGDAAPAPGELPAGGGAADRGRSRPDSRCGRASVCARMTAPCATFSLLVRATMIRDYIWSGDSRFEAEAGRKGYPGRRPNFASKGNVEISLCAIP